MEHKRPRIGSAVLVEKDGKFLLGERNKKNYQGYWVIPGGGVRWGEKIQDAAIREIKEETNLDVEIVKLICYREIIRTDVDYHRIVFFHLAKPLNSDIKAAEDLSKAGFFSVEEMKKLKLAESAIHVLKEIGVWED